jgi:signal transduction histidine kinase
VIAATLVGRVAGVQLAVTLSSLAAVGVGTSLLLTSALTRRADQELTGVATRVGSLVEMQSPSALDEQALVRELQEIRPTGMRVEVRDVDGRLRAGAGEPLVLPVELHGCQDRSLLRSCGSPAGLFRLCGVHAGRFTVVTAAPRAADLATRNQALAIAGVMCAIAAVIVALLGRAITRRTLRPLADLATRVVTIEPGTGQRVGVSSGLRELEILEVRFDDLIERFDDALARERRLAAQASHELRTPLTVARAEVEALTRHRDDDGAAARRALAALDGLSHLVDALLWFARTEQQLDVDRMDLINLADLVRSALAEHASGTPAHLVRCDAPDEALVRGDERLLARVVANLVDNAVKYGEDAPIEIRVVRNAATLELRVANRTSTLTDELAERIFEPFVRLAGSADVPGFGLGLAFARAVARSHGGTLVLAIPTPQVAELVLTLPLVAWSDAPVESARSGLRREL